MNIRLRSKKGVIHLTGIDPSLPFSSFQQLVQEKTGIHPSYQKLLTGYPPLAITDAGDAIGISRIIANGEIVTLEEEKTPNISITKKKEEFGRSEFGSRVSPTAQAEGGEEVDGFFLVRRKIADDNSCLFNAVGYVLEGRSLTRAPQLRSLVASTVVADRDTYSEAVLGEPNDKYAQWILDPKHWGGAIELAILCEHYRAEIAAFDIATKRMWVWGEGIGFSQRVYLVYDGIHYDALAMNPVENGPEEFDVTVFDANDQQVFVKAQALLDKLNREHQYTNIATFQLLCTICGNVLTGEKEASVHAKSTGHTAFVEKK